MERNNIHLDIFNYIAKPTKNFIAEKNAGYQSNVSFLHMCCIDKEHLLTPYLLHHFSKLHIL